MHYMMKLMYVTYVQFNQNCTRMTTVYLFMDNINNIALSVIQ